MPSSLHKKPHSEIGKCRKVIRSENREMWCTQCKRKKNMEEKIMNTEGIHKTELSTMLAEERSKSQESMQGAVQSTRDGMNEYLEEQRQTELSTMLAEERSKSQESMQGAVQSMRDGMNEYLEEQRQENLSKYLEQCDEITKLQNENQELKEKLRISHESEESTRKIYEQAQTMVDMANKENEKRRSELEDMQFRNSELMERLSIQKDEMEEMKSRTSTLENDLKNTQSNLQEKEDELKRVMESLESVYKLREENEQLEKTVASLHTLANKDREERVEMETQLQSHTSTIKTLMEENKTLLEQNTDLVGHSNHKQKIKYHEKLKDENLQLKKVLCSLISAALIDGCKLVSVRRKVLATVWLLANTESYRSVADRFKFSKGQLHSIVQSVCHALVGLKQEYIKWPTSNELEAMSNGWTRKRPGFPGVIGAIDGTYIPIQGCGGQDRDSYICRKGFPAMHLQVVCDSNHKFLDVYTGYPGSVHDARVFKNSNLGVHLESPDGKLPPNFHLLGDSAYPNSSYLLTPFRDNGHLTSKEKRYNKMHSEIRVTVEHSIGLLKGKFRRLKYLAMGNYAEIPFIIFACCILHNFLLMSNDTDGDDFHFCCNEIEEASEVYENADNLDRSGDVKRREIADLL